MRIMALFLLNIIFNALANFLMKLGMMRAKTVKLNQLNDIIQKLLLNPLLVLGCVCFGLSLVFYSLILRNMNLNIAYPIIVSGSVLLVTVISSLFLLEPLHLVNIFGVALILIGIFLVVH